MRTNGATRERIIPWDSEQVSRASFLPIRSNRKLCKIHCFWVRRAPTLEQAGEKKFWKRENSKPSRAGTESPC